MAEVAGPQPVPESDLRARVVALLIASDGAVLGGATVFSSDKAVTTADVAKSALAKAEALAGSRPHPLGPLMITFPQFRGSPGARSVPLEVQAIDAERGFGVLNLLVSGKDPVANPIALPAPIPSGLLGGGEIPEEGSECDVLYNEERQPNQFFLLCLSGRVRGRGGRTGLRFRLDLDGKAPQSILGAPVFKAGLMVGIVASDLQNVFDHKNFGPGFGTSLFVEVLSVAAMAQSEVTPVVGNLLGRREANPAAARPSPTGMGIKQIGEPDNKAAESLDQKRNEDADRYDPSRSLEVGVGPTRVQKAIGANPTPKVDSDLWSEQDRLGYEAYARTIASLITHKETKPPLTIGIKAPWGAGKTTLMKRVQHLLDGDAKLSEENRSGTMQQGQPSQVTLRELLKELKSGAVPARLETKRGKDGDAYGLEARITVWFNAWKYQTSEQIWAGMAHCIISQITARMGVRDRELFWVRLHARRVNADEVRAKVYEMIARQLLPLALVVIVAVAIVIWVSAGIQLLVPYHFVIRGISLLAGLIVLVWKGWSKLGDKAAGTVRDLIREPDYEGKMGYLHLVESDIREVLQLATAASVTAGNPRGNPLVVFVDDLDRCAPNKVAEVVEAINLFLCGDYPNCVFVIGMEPGMVAAALEVANKDVIAKAEEMGLVDRTAPVGWRFMEKIVQLPIMIPPPTEAGRHRYVNSLTGLGVGAGESLLFGEPPLPSVITRANAAIVGAVMSRPQQHGAQEEAKVQNYIEKIGSVKGANEAARRGEVVVAQAPQEERWAAQEAGKRIYEHTLSELDPVMVRLVEEVAQLVDGNPRQIKRYVNVFRFYSTLRHSLRLEGVIPGEDLPSDEVLAKFVALSIQWPHAVDCMRVMVDGADGKKVSLLKRLETESRGLSGGGATSDEAWKKVVDGLKLPSWAEERAFREFLAGEESLCEKEGHGLW